MKIQWYYSRAGTRNQANVVNECSLDTDSAAMITHSKPHPEVFLKAASMIGLDPHDCLVVEDARAGVEAAAEGGFECAAIGDAGDDKRAKWHLDHLSDLLKL